MPAEVPAGLAARGSALWQALNDERNLSGGGADLALEACRIADRLDKLDETLRNPDRAWTYLRQQERHDPEVKKYVVVMTGALAEARQQALVLRQIVAGLPMKGEDDDDTDADAFFAQFGQSSS